MSNNKKEGNAVGQIAVGILVALIAGSTSPWWWDKVFSSPTSLPQGSTGREGPTGGDVTGSTSSPPPTSPGSTGGDVTGSTSSPPPTSKPSPPVDPSPVEPSEDIIRSVITTAYIHRSNGFLTRDRSEFQKSYTGEALKNLEAKLTGNEARGVSAILFNYDYSYTKFENYKVIDNNEKVKIRATRRINNITFWKNASTCVGYQPGSDRTEDFELKRTSQGWLISNIAIVAGGSEKSENPPCPVDRLP